MADSTLTYDDFGGVFDMSDRRLGGVVGLGVERALSDRSSFKAEALFAKYTPAEAFSGLNCDGPPGFESGGCNMLGYDTNMTLKAGMSIKF